MNETVLSSELMQQTFIVVPAYNENDCLERVIRELRLTRANVVVVDDGSTDETYDTARREATFVLRHVVNRGQGAALQTGIEFSLSQGARFIVTFDADGQHQVEDVPRLLQPIVRGECDVCLGSRFLGESIGMPWVRKMTLRLGVLFTRISSGVKLTDAHNGLRAFSQRAARQICITLDGMAHASELIDIISHAGLIYQEVPVSIRYTKRSLTKGQSPWNAFRIVFDYLLSRTSK